MADVKWIKICTDIFDDEKILLIESLPEADSIIVVWFKLLCLAGKQNNSGVFMMNNKVAYTEEMLATIFRRKITTIRLALDTFEQFGMIERFEGVVTIPNWEKHQSLDQLELARENTRKRVAKHRAKQKLLANNGCNVTETLPVTECNGDRKDKNRLEKEKKDKLDKNDKPLTSDFDIEIHNLTSELIKRKFISETDLDIYKYNDFFNELLTEYDFNLICKVVNYVIARMKVNDSIESKFGYFKTSVLENINQIKSFENMKDDPLNWLNW